MSTIRPRALFVCSLAGFLLASVLSTAPVYAQGKTKTYYLDISATNSYDFGRFYGSGARDLINKRYNYLRQAGSTDECLRMLKKCQSSVVRELPNAMEESSGMAAAIGREPADTFLLGNLIPVWDLVAFSGTTVGLSPSHTADGKSYLAVNVDGELEQSGFGVVIRRRPPGKPTSLMWTLAGGSGFAGISSTGVAITAVWLKVDDEGIVPGVPSELAIREALLAKDFEAARLVIAECPVVSSFAVIMTDGKGKFTVIERTPEIAAGHTTGEDWIAHTNHFLDAGIAKSDVGKKMFPDTFARYKTVEKAMDANKKFTLDQLKALMGNHDGNPNGICRHGTAKTIASIIICPEDGSLSVTQGNPCKSKWETFRLDTPVDKN